MEEKIKASGHYVNRFFSTALGKTTQTFLWTIGSYLAALALTDLAKVHWSDKAVALGIPGLINLVVYTAKVFADKEVPNLPSSTPMRLIPAATVIQPLKDVEVISPTVPEDGVTEKMGADPKLASMAPDSPTGLVG